MARKRHTFKDYRIGFCDCDHQGQLHLHRLIDYAQDCDDTNCALIGATSESLFKRGACWILLAYAARFTGEFPRTGDSLIVESWSSGARGVRCYRENRYYRNRVDPAHSVGVGTSEWIICALDNHWPLRPSTVLDLETFESGSCRETAYLDKIPRLETAEGAPDDSFDFSVGYSDLDLNQHLHNTHYVKLAVDATARFLAVDPRQESLRVQSLQIDFLKEANYLRTLTVSARRGPGGSGPVLVEGSDGDDRSFLAAVTGTVSGRE